MRMPAQAGMVKTARVRYSGGDEDSRTPTATCPVVVRDDPTTSTRDIRPLAAGVWIASNHGFE